MNGHRWETASAIFDPADWIVLPNGDGLPRGVLGRPSGCCGASVFVLVVRMRGEVKVCSVQCERCVRLKQGDRIVGRMDRLTGEIWRD